MSNIKFTSVDRILAKATRDLQNIDYSESDAIEWIGEAAEFLSIYQVQEQAVDIIKVENFEAQLPENFHLILQVAKYNNIDCNEIPCQIKDKNNCNPCEEIEDKLDCNTCEEETYESDCDDECEPCLYETNSCDFDELDYDFVSNFDPTISKQWQYHKLINNESYRNNFTPIRLANHTFFNSLVCKEKDINYNDYGVEEYTIIGSTNKKLRFSFKEGYIALAYLRNAIDEESGYPLIPDDIRFVTAISYYLKWKIAEMYNWNGREGYERKAANAEQRWLKYARQAKNYAKMPKTIDEFQNLLDQSHYIIPRKNRYYGFFGNSNYESYNR